MKAKPVSEDSSDRLERAARAVAEASGYTYLGESLVVAARKNPRAHQFVRIARAVMETLDSVTGCPDGRHDDFPGIDRTVVAHQVPMKHKLSD
jgi:hypothetical protein